MIGVAKGPSEAVEEAAPGPTAKRALRRRVLLGGLAAAATGSAGVALGYRFRTELRAFKQAVLAYPLELPSGMSEFRRDAARIIEKRDRETAETVAGLKARYERPIFGRVRVWDLIEKLALCIDPTDCRLFCTSHYVHFQQVLAAMEQNGVDDPDMLLTAVIHDLGQVLLLAGEAPEHVVGLTARIQGGVEGEGLDGVTFQFGHGEFIYSRIRGYVPDHVAFVARFHNVRMDQARPFMNQRELEWTEKYLIPFRTYDGSFATPYFLPRIDLSRYRDLIERTFPSPLLV